MLGTLTKSVEDISQAIERYQLMSSKDLAAMRSRWFRPDRKEVDNPEAFRKWLVVNRYITDFVAKVVSGRKADQLVLNQYRLIDQLISGPMAGSYLAIDPLDRHVAVEVLASRSAADKAVLAGFQQAAHKAMDVNHPNVGRILDTGEAHGLYYLVKEYYEGPTLEDVLERRGKLPYQQAARIMALALAGVEALHSHGVPAGDLAADCLLLAPASKDAPNQRTVKVLHAGVRRRLFDETAIGRSISMIQGIPDELELAASTTFEVAEAGAPNPPEDIFRLGCLFYRCVTGKAPFSEKELPTPAHPAVPVCEVAPEVPEMLGRIIDEMIAPAPADRPQKAAHVAKSLRVFLAAEEHGREAQAEEHITSPTARVAPKAAEEEPVEEEEEADEEEVEEKEAAPRRLARKKALADQEGLWGKAVALWEEVHPEVRDLVFLASGALLMLALIFLVHLLTGLRITFIAGLFVGAVASYLVEMFLRWRQQKKAEVS
jgi:serine/threonine protein kinase